MHQLRSLLPSFACKTWLERLGLLILLLCIPNAASHALLSNGANAENLLGQIASYPGSGTVKYTTNPTPSPIGFSTPYGVAMDTVNHRLFVGDISNNRILVFALNSDHSTRRTQGAVG